MISGGVLLEEEKTYEELIRTILNTRGRFNCGDEYHERHHILPKCMGGGNEEENLIDLYAKEHFIAHKLLALENPDNDKLIYAYTCMAFLKNDYEHRYELTPEEYEEAKIMFANSQKGKHRSEETKEKIRQKTKEQMSDPMMIEMLRGKAKEQMSNPEMIEVLRRKAKKQMSNPAMIKILRERKLGVYDGDKNPMYGKHHTDESKKRISEAKKGKQLGKNNPNYGNGRHVIQLSCFGEYIVEYISADEAEKLTGVNRSSIRRCCCHKQKTAGGYKWMYVEDYLKMIENA